MVGKAQQKSWPGKLVVEASYVVDKGTRAWAVHSKRHP